MPHHQQGTNIGKADWPGGASVLGEWGGHMLVVTSSEGGGLLHYGHLGKWTSIRRGLGGCGHILVSRGEQEQVMIRSQAGQPAYHGITSSPLVYHNQPAYHGVPQSTCLPYLTTILPHSTPAYHSQTTYTVSIQCNFQLEVKSIPKRNCHRIL